MPKMRSACGSSSASRATSIGRRRRLHTSPTSTGRKPTKQSKAEDEDPLLGACRLVCAHLGVAVRAPQLVGQSRKQSDPIIAIARASRVRVRRVALKGDWWRQENGPLVAYLASDDQPVAILPASPTRYEIVDERNQTRVPLTAASAAALQPFAHSFYRPFAAKALTMWQVLRFALKGSGRDWVVVGLMGLAGSLLGLVTPIVTGWIFDWIIPGAERSQLLLVILALIVSALAAAVFQITNSIAQLRLQTRMDSDAQAAVWDRLLDLPAPFFRRFTAGDLADRSMAITSDPAGGHRCGHVGRPQPGLLAGLFRTPVLLRRSAGPPRQRHLRGARGRHQPGRGRADALSTPVLRDTRRNRRLRLSIDQRAVADPRGRRRGEALAVWTRKFTVQRRLAFRTRWLTNNLATFNAMVQPVATTALFAAFFLTSRQDLSLGSFLAFNVAFGQVLSAAVMVSSMVGSVAAVIPLQERTKLIIETPPEVDIDKAQVSELSGAIEIGHVFFRYHPDGPLILNDVNVHVRPGEFVAFVGPSGAGKSTIIRMLLGFEKPTSGSIYYDRLDLAGLDLQAVRRQMGVVLQDAKLMAGDILTNITGSGRFTEEDAWAAAALSGLDDDIKQMPMGMYTVIGEGGSTLSGGQRQRLMIARAVVAKPSVLIFDEATSALDNETQAKVSASLERLRVTRVVVAHRLSTVVGADRIYVLDQGRIVQTGSFQDLMRQPGLFAELAQRQLA